MAGRASQTERANRLQAALTKAETERDKYKRILIGIDPALLEMDKPAPLEAYDAEVLNRILAMAEMGMTEYQWLAEFGISQKVWKEWKLQYPELIETIDQAYTRALAWWDEKARLAQEHTNVRFPMALHKKMTDDLKERMASREEEDPDLGDASKLVVVDLRK